MSNYPPQDPWNPQQPGQPEQFPQQGPYPQQPGSYDPYQAPGQYTPPQQPFPGQPPYPGDYGYGAPPPPPPRKKSPLPWIIGGIAAFIVVCLVVSLVVGIGVSRNIANQATATPEATSTPEATATPATSSTPEATATPGTTSTGSPVFTEDFSSNAHGWFVGKTASGDGNFEITNGALIITGTKNLDYYESVPVNSGQGVNFSLKVDTKLSAGDNNDAAVVIFRESSDRKNGYRVYIYPDGTSIFYKQSNGQYTSLQKVQNSAIHGVGQTNTLEVSAHGSTFTLSVNGAQVLQVNDSSNPTGELDVAAGHGNTSSSIKAEFRNLVINP